MSRRPDRMKHQMRYRYYPACSPSFWVFLLFLLLFFALYVQPVHRSRRCCAPSPFFSFFAASDHFLSLSNWLGCLHSFELTFFFVIGVIPDLRSSSQSFSFLVYPSNLPSVSRLQVLPRTVECTVEQTGHAPISSTNR
ncbi:hypothetical protein F5Y10DRAFT_98349 [Nemania abortiva]|nr:hypothetical protein F5Y10DRAFT_98349 [Nemania abortiva]